MALPKYKRSRRRRNMSRAHKKLASPRYGVCPKCGANKRPHRICPSCGHYKDIAVVEKS